MKNLNAVGWLALGVAIASSASVLASSSAWAAGSAWEPGDTRCVPNFRADKPVGYLCVKVERGSVYDRAGVRAGDNVTRLNGESLADAHPDRAIDLWKEFEKQPDSTVEVERNGRLIQLHRPNPARTVSSMKP